MHNKKIYTTLKNMYMKLKQKGGQTKLKATIILLPTFIKSAEVYQNVDEHIEEDNYNENENENDYKCIETKLRKNLIDECETIDQFIVFFQSLENQPNQTIKYLDDEGDKLTFDVVPHYNFTNILKDKKTLFNFDFNDFKYFIDYINDENNKLLLQKYTKFSNNFLQTKLIEHIQLCSENIKMINDDLWYKFNNDTQKYDFFKNFINNAYDETYKSYRLIYGIKIDFSDAKNVIVIGDLHSSNMGLASLLNDIKKNFNEDMTLKDGNYLVCTGDILDRGVYNIEVYLFFLILKIKNPNNVFLIAGNHEEHMFSYFNEENTSVELILELLHNIFNDMLENGTQINPQLVMNIIHYFLISTSLMPNVIFGKMPNGKIIQFCHGGIDIDLYDISNFLQSDQTHLFIDFKRWNNGIKIFGNGLLWNDFKITDNEIVTTNYIDKFLCFANDKDKKEYIIQQNENDTFYIILKDNNNNKYQYTLPSVNLIRGTILENNLLVKDVIYKIYYVTINDDKFRNKKYCLKKNDAVYGVYINEQIGTEYINNFFIIKRNEHRVWYITMDGIPIDIDINSVKVYKFGEKFYIVDKKDTRMQLGTNILNDYLKINNISVLIGGHQDNIPFAYITKEHLEEINYVKGQINTNEFEISLKYIHTSIITNMNDNYIENENEYEHEVRNDDELTNIITAFGHDDAKITINNNAVLSHIETSYKSYDLYTHQLIANILKKNTIHLNEDEFEKIGAIILSACNQAKGLLQTGYLILNYN